MGDTVAQELVIKNDRSGYVVEHREYPASCWADVYPSPKCSARWMVETADDQVTSFDYLGTALTYALDQVARMANRA